MQKIWIINSGSRNYIIMLPLANSTINIYRFTRSCNQLPHDNTIVYHTNACFEQNHKKTVNKQEEKHIKTFELQSIIHP